MGGADLAPMTDMEHLRERAATYLRDAAATDDERVAARLIMLAARCQEWLFELEHRALDRETDPGL